MPRREAAHLRDLLTVREVHRESLRARPGYLGSAVGFKYSERRRELLEREGNGLGRFIPCILLFVDQKADPTRNDLLAPELSAGELFCATDVVVGYPGRTDLDLAPLDTANQILRRELREGGEGVFAGMPLTSALSLGAAAGIVYPRQDPSQPGLLTAQHVAGRAGTVVERPPPRSTSLGVTATQVREVPAAGHLGGFPLTDATFRLDAAFVRLFPGVSAAPGPADRGNFAGRDEPPALSIDQWSLLGLEVDSTGPVRGRQRGRIVGFAYEWNLGERRQMTDWLIVGEHGGVFAEPGDSGKLVLRADNQQPVALLWGGRPFVNLGSGHQEAWCYASHLQSVLAALDVTLNPGTPPDLASPSEPSPVQPSKPAPETQSPRPDSHETAA